MNGDPDDRLWLAATCSLAGYAIATSAAFTTLYVAVMYPAGVDLGGEGGVVARAALAEAAALAASAAAAALAPIVVVTSALGVGRRAHTVALIAALIAALPAVILRRP